MSTPGADKKIIGGILGILLGAFGIHKFYLGYTKEGLIMLLATLVGSFITFGIAGFVMGVIGLIEGILYLVKPDDQFVATYVTGRKGWFESAPFPGPRPASRRSLLYPFFGDVAVQPGATPPKHPSRQLRRGERVEGVEVLDPGVFLRLLVGVVAGAHHRAALDHADA
jgi:TM2 domain-containing membrane protein YozV